MRALSALILLTLIPFYGLQLQASGISCEQYLNRGTLLTPWMQERWNHLNVRGQRTIVANIHNFVYHRAEARPLTLKDQTEFLKLLLRNFGEQPRIDEKTAQEIWIPRVLMELAELPHSHSQAVFELEEILMMFDTYEPFGQNRIR